MFLDEGVRIFCLGQGDDAHGGTLPQQLVTGAECRLQAGLVAVVKKKDILRELPECAGTICGDDTIFVACRSNAEAKALGSKLAGELQ